MKINEFKTRVSIRDFTSKKLSQKQLNDITEIINNSPTSTNSQQFSAIIITDPKIKKWMSEMNWGQKHIEQAAAIIIFVADRTRILKIIEKAKITHSKNMGHHEFMRGVIDATIAATYAHDALITMGYGATFIGGPSAHADALHKKINLPESTMVVTGLSVGWPKTREGFKPKMNKVFINKYNKTETFKELKRYNEVLGKYYKKRKTTGDYYEWIINTSDKRKAYATPFGDAGKYILKKFKSYK